MILIFLRIPPADLQGQPVFCSCDYPLGCSSPPPRNCFAFQFRRLLAIIAILAISSGPSFVVQNFGLPPLPLFLCVSKVLIFPYQRSSAHICGKKLWLIADC